MKKTLLTAGRASHAMNVAAVVLYGEPKIAEPLSVAHLRMQEKLDKQFAAAVDEL